MKPTIIIVLTLSLLAVAGCAPNGEPWNDVGNGLFVSPTPPPEFEDGLFGDYVAENAVSYNATFAVLNRTDESFDCSFGEATEATEVEPLHFVLAPGDSEEFSAVGLTDCDSGAVWGNPRLLCSDGGGGSVGATWYVDCSA